MREGRVVEKKTVKKKDEAEEERRSGEKGMKWTFRSSDWSPLWRQACAAPRSARTASRPRTRMPPQVRQRPREPVVRESERLMVERRRRSVAPSSVR